MENNLNVTVIGELWAALLCFLAFLVMVLYRKETTKDRCVRRMLFICLLMLVSDAATWYFDGLPGSSVKIILYVSNYLLYTSSYLIVALFIWYLWQMAQREAEPVPMLFRIFWGGVAVSVAALTVGIFFNFYFYIDAQNVYHRTDNYIISQLITILGVITLAWATLRYRQRLSRFEFIATCAYFILPPLGTVIQSFHYGVACQQFAFAIATLITFYVREADVRRELQETTNRELGSRKELQEKLRINAALSQEYTGIFMINCDDGSMKILKLDGNQNAASMDNAGISYDDFRRNYLFRFALPEYSEDIIRFSELDNLIRYFEEGNKDILVRYRTKPNRAGQTNFEIHAVPFLHGDSNQIIFGCRCIDARVSREEETREIIGSLGKAYFCMYYIDLSTGEYRQLEEPSLGFVSEAIPPEGNASDAFRIMCRNLVAAEQADEVLQFTDVAAISQRLQNQDTVGIHFYGPHIGWCEGLFVSAKRDDAGNCLNAIWAVRDINEMKLRELAYQRELEEARDSADAANLAKTSFLFNMSHDIRTPMNAIIGYTDLIEKHYDDREKCMDYLHKTQQSNRILLSLINDVLEMARIESGKAHLEEVVTPVGAIARELSDIFRDQMKQKHIAYISHVETHTELAFYDQAKVREIYLNILSNALKYTPAGGTVSMQVNEIPWELPGYIGMKAVVSDTGIGMSKEFLPHLFEAFSREHTATESRQQGTGLGMPIVKKILDLMGGTIEVESEPGKGSVFTVTYPLKVEGVLSAERQDEPAAEAADFSGKRILLAEDNDLNAEIAAEILSESGFRTERAEDGSICVDMLQKAECGYYDLILMDIQMPNLNGYDATRQIRALPEKEKAEIPVIAMTANAFASDKQDALNAGMNAHIAKPIEIPKLLETLSQVLSEQKRLSGV